MKARKGVHVRPIVSRCPWREREAHETTKPDILTEAEIQDIAVQISENGYRALPFVETGKQFFSCRDCYAVWLAGSVFERVPADQVSGVYDIAFIWTPAPETEKKE